MLHDAGKSALAGCCRTGIPLHPVVTVMTTAGVICICDWGHAYRIDTFEFLSHAGLRNVICRSTYWHQMALELLPLPWHPRL